MRRIDIGVDTCEALGLDPNRVQSLSIHMAAGAQNRVGTASADKWRNLKLNAGGHTVATAGPRGFDVRPLASSMGRKVGSR